MTYEIKLGDLKPEIAKELVEQGFANKNNDTIPIVVLEQMVCLTCNNSGYVGKNEKCLNCNT